MKKALQLTEQRFELVQKLALPAQLVYEKMNFYHAAVDCKRMGISCEVDPEVLKQDALKSAKMYGDIYIYGCINNIFRIKMRYSF